MYKKTISIDSEWKHVYVDIPGAEQHAVVFADDCKIGEHRGAYGGFRCEIPEELRKMQQLSKCLQISGYHPNPDGKSELY